MRVNRTTRACEPWRANAGAECTCSDRHTGIWEMARWKEAHHASMSSSVSAARRKYFAPVIDVTYAALGGLSTLRWLQDEKEGVLDVKELPGNLCRRRSQYAKVLSSSALVVTDAPSSRSIVPLMDFML